FEAKIENGPSIAAGGRFDKLIGLYGGNETPACGFSFGVSRIFDYLKERDEKVRVNGLYLFGIKIDNKKILEIATKLREAGIICEIDLMDKSISKNFEYAEKKGYRVVGMIGENELKSDTISMKNMFNGMQFSIEIDTKKIKKLFDN
ncbi:MAG: His/Gly/Thr/Pro-type tRNA ligase C-terminal domain-containing protein, partial [Nanoarchaeota archaeon]|nr:His/Gly/Thr/Pro-type tRNA ligase C-terminal domain-containing protein [Nanoarchaeota archaeon]